jgi:hypothetical protein
MMGQNWLTAFIQCCLPTQRPQRSGIQIEAKLYQEGHENPISSDLRFYYPDATNYYILAHDPVELSAFHKENRITLDTTTITDTNTPATIKFNLRRGLHVETKDVTVNIGEPKKETFPNSNLYAILSASKATRPLN